MNKKYFIVFITLLCVSAANADRDDDFVFAQKLYSDGYYDLAAEQFANFVENYPDDYRLPSAYFIRGKALFAIEEWDKARVAFLRVALEFSDSKNAPDALYQSGQCLKNQERWKEAARSFLSVYDYYPKSEFAAKGIVEAGVIYRLLGESANAEAVFKRIIRTYPGTVSAAMSYFYLAEIAGENGDDAQALQDYFLAGQLAEDDAIEAQVHIRRALIYYRLGDWNAAESEIENVKSPPDYFSYVSILKGIWTQKRGDYANAERMLIKMEQNTENDTLRVLAKLGLGDNAFLTGDFASALEYYRNLPPADSVALRLGFTFQELDSVDQAVDAFTRALKTEGSYEVKAAALERLKDLFNESGEKQQISEVLSSYLPKLKQLPNWDSFAINLGIIAYNEGNYQLGEGFFSALNDVHSPWSDDAVYYLGLIYESENNLEKAIRLYEKFQRKFPGSDFALEVEGRLDEMRNNLPADNLVDEIARLSASSYNFENKSELALSWGRLYFESFKDYSKACEQLSLALNSEELSSDKEASALGLLASALVKRSKKEISLADSARSVMKVYLRKAPQGDFAGRFSLFLLKYQVSTLKDSAQKRKTYMQGLGEIYGRYGSDQVMPEVLSELVKVYAQSPDGVRKVIEYRRVLSDRFPANPLNQNAILNSAEVRLSAGDTSGAKLDYDEYISEYPEGFGIFTARLKAAELTPEFKDKLAQLNSLIVEFYYHSQAPEVIETLGDLYASQGLYRAALQRYLALVVLPQSPLSPGRNSDIEYKIGLNHQRLGELAEAQERFLSYTISNPNGAFWEEAIFALAEISESEERPPAALKFYQNLLSRSDKQRFDKTALERIAAIYYRIEKYSEGRKIYLQLADNTPDPAMQMEYSASAIIGLYRQGLLENARREAIEFAKEYKKSPLLKEYQAKFFLAKGKALAAEKNFSEALKSLKYILKKYPNSAAVAEAKYETGKIYLITNRFEEALDILTKISDEYPDNPMLPSVYITLGAFYYRQSQMQNALVSFQRVLDDSAGREHWPLALQNLEMTYKDLGLYEAALSVVNRYLEMYPYRDDVLLKKLDAAQILLRLREYDRAIKKFAEILPLASEDMKVEVQFYLGEAYFQKGDFQQAVLEYMKVKYIDPGTGLDWAVTSIYNAGKCYEKLGRYDEARKMYREIIDRWGANSNYGIGAQNRIDLLDKMK